MTSMVDRLMRDPGFAELASRMIAKDTALFHEVCEQAGVDMGRLEELASCADITHARQLGLVKLLANSPAVEIFADAGCQ